MNRKNPHLLAEVNDIQKLICFNFDSCGRRKITWFPVPHSTACHCSKNTKFYKIISRFQLFFKVILYWWHHAVFIKLRNYRWYLKLYPNFRKFKFKKKKEVDWLYLIAYTNSNSRWILETNMKGKTIRLLKRNHRGNFLWHVVGKDKLHIKSTNHLEKNEK